jgi:hypothetical protein
VALELDEGLRVEPARRAGIQRWRVLGRYRGSFTGA